MLVTRKHENISLPKGWMVTTLVNDEGELYLSVSNQQGKVLIGGDEDWEQECYTETYKVSKEIS